VTFPGRVDGRVVGVDGLVLGRVVGRVGLVEGLVLGRVVGSVGLVEGLVDGRVVGKVGLVEGRVVGRDVGVLGLVVGLVVGLEVLGLVVGLVVGLDTLGLVVGLEVGLLLDPVNALREDELRLKLERLGERLGALDMPPPREAPELRLPPPPPKLRAIASVRIKGPQATRIVTILMKIFMISVGCWVLLGNLRAWGRRPFHDGKLTVWNDL